jgi:hypothetical protein
MCDIHTNIDMNFFSRVKQSEGCPRGRRAANLRYSDL